MLHENNTCQNFRKTNISYPLIHKRTWRALLSCNTRFEIYLLPYTDDFKLMFYFYTLENLKKPKKLFKCLIAGWSKEANFELNIIPIQVKTKSHVAYEEHATALLISINFHKAYRLSKLKIQNL